MEFHFIESDKICVWSTGNILFSVYMEGKRVSMKLTSHLHLLKNVWSHNPPSPTPLICTKEELHFNLYIRTFELSGKVWQVVREMLTPHLGIIVKNRN